MENTTYLLFTVKGCGTCEAMKEAVKAKVDIKGTLIEGDSVHDLGGIAEDFGVTSVPALIFVKDGDVVRWVNEPSKV